MAGRRPELVKWGLTMAEISLLAGATLALEQMTMGGMSLSTIGMVSGSGGSLTLYSDSSIEFAK